MNNTQEQNQVNQIPQTSNCDVVIAYAREVRRGVMALYIERYNEGEELSRAFLEDQRELSFTIALELYRHHRQWLNMPKNGVENIRMRSRIGARMNRLAKSLYPGFGLYKLKATDVASIKLIGGKHIQVPR